MRGDNQGQHLKVISPTLHSIIDYILIAVLLVSPSLLELSGMFAYGAYGLAAVYLLLVLTTQYAGGIFLGISFRVHGVLELLLALGAVVSPWVFQFAGQANPRNFFLVFGITLFALVFFTHYQPEDDQSIKKTKQANSGIDDSNYEQKQDDGGNKDQE